MERKHNLCQTFLVWQVSAITHRNQANEVVDFDGQGTLITSLSSSQMGDLTLIGGEAFQKNDAWLSSRAARTDECAVSRANNHYKMTKNVWSSRKRLFF